MAPPAADLSLAYSSGTWTYTFTCTNQNRDGTAVTVNVEAIPPANAYTPCSFYYSALTINLIYVTIVVPTIPTMTYDLGAS